MDTANNVKYIYQLPLHSLWNIQDEDTILYIVDDDYEYNPKKNELVYHLSEWFDLVASCHILPWICACLNKKFVIKEHVKLLMTTNPLKIRHWFDQFVSDATYEGWPENSKQLLTIYAILYTQILENHKIVNFMAPKRAIQQSYDIMDDQFVNWLKENPAKLLYNWTNGVLEQENKRILQEKIQRITASKEECKTITT